MERQSSSDSERTISDNERVGSSERSERKRKWEEGTTSTGFGSGPAAKHHLRFTGTAIFQIDLDMEPPCKESEQQHHAHNQAEPETPYFLKRLDVPLGQATQAQQKKVHDQVGTSRSGVSSDVKPVDLDLHLGQADSTREYTLIDFAEEALRLNGSEPSIPLNEGMLRFTVEHPFTDDKYNAICNYLRSKGVENKVDIERKMHRVYRYNLTANKRRRQSHYNATTSKMHSTNQQ